MDQGSSQSVIDAEHLRLLRIGYLVSSGVSAFFGLFGLLYAAMGAFVTSVARFAQPTNPHQIPPEQFGWVVMVFGLGFTLFFLGIAALKYQVARNLKGRRGWTFCMVVAALCCMGVPYGTLLGIFTFMVMSRPSVHALFGDRPPPVPVAEEIGGGA